MLIVFGIVLARRFASALATVESLNAGLEQRIAAREAAKAICRQRYVEFGCEGQAPKIKPLSLDEVAARYASGALSQTVV